MNFVITSEAKFPARRNDLRAFTLPELLAVIVVIAILMVLTFVSFGLMRQKSHTVKCVANLRQIGVVFGLYLAEHNMCFPPTSNANQILVGGQKGSSSDGAYGKPEIRPLNQYVDGNYQIFKCPADVGYRNNPNRENMQSEFKGKTYFEVLGSSYRYNARDIFGTGASLTKVRAANGEMYRLFDIKSPSRFIVMGDSDVFSMVPTSVPWWTHWHGTSRENSEWPIANVLFADWHVETIVVSDKPAPYNFGDNYHFDVGNQH